MMFPWLKLGHDNQVKWSILWLYIKFFSNIFGKNTSIRLFRPLYTDKGHEKSKHFYSSCQKMGQIKFKHSTVFFKSHRKYQIVSISEQGGVNSDEIYKFCNNVQLSTAQKSCLNLASVVVSAIGQADDTVFMSDCLPNYMDFFSVMSLYLKRLNY